MTDYYHSIHYSTIDNTTLLNKMLEGSIQLETDNLSVRASLVVKLNVNKLEQAQINVKSRLQTSNNLVRQNSTILNHINLQNNRESSGLKISIND
jgi:hypothetical protein